MKSVRVKQSRDVECSGKKRYVSYWAAQRAARQMNRWKHDGKLHEYRCDFCRFYHIGNNTKKPQS